ncbi:hypothetical protein [Butyrivibrio sp. FCS014]|uniref:hypothetical protein n=1 Tax=Butyrivibrio sp. FCS014 TaxID=1408304 RepID=UPI0004B80C26|nr:hypothetical protein [Butyrivibrio sp. FCS014]
MKTGLPISKPVIGAIAGAVLIIVIIAVVVATRGGVKYNDPEKAPVTQTAIAGYEAFSSDKLDISFLYPSSAQIRDNGAKGVYVYTSGNQGIPYIQIENKKGSVKTDAYFKDYKKTLLKDFSDANVSNINKVDITDKTLYMMRSSVFVDGADQVIDRYIEQYKNRTIIYTVKSYSEGSEDLALKAIVESLRPDDGAYAALAGSSGTGTFGGDETQIDVADGEESEDIEDTGEDDGVIMPGDPGDEGSEIDMGDFGDEETGEDLQGTGDFQQITAPDYSFGFMAESTLIENVTYEQGSVQVYPKGMGSESNVAIFVAKNDYHDQGITTAKDFITAYTDGVKSNGGNPSFYSIDGAYFKFEGTQTLHDGTWGDTLWATADNNGYIYTIYYDYEGSNAELYNTLAYEIMYSFMVSQ